MPPDCTPDPRPTHFPTGTGPHRRRLTLEEAELGAGPEPYTDTEWRALHAASRAEAHAGMMRAHLPADVVALTHTSETP